MLLCGTVCSMSEMFQMQTIALLYVPNETREEVDQILIYIAMCSNFTMSHDIILIISDRSCTKGH